MNRKLGLAAASAFALASCQVTETNNQTAADVAANIPADANITAAEANAAEANAAAATALADDYQYGPAPNSLPAGAQLAVLHGNPNEAGPFVIRLRFPAGYSVPAHWHPTEEQATVITGNVSLGMGDRLDRSAAKAYGPGSFFVTGARMNHYAFTDSGATIQLAAEGPIQITYVNPADDPRTKTSG
jgi:hypothetical protein